MTRGKEAAGFAESDEVSLQLVPGAGPDEEADAVDFLRASGLSLSSVVLGLLDQSDDCIKLVGSDGSLRFMNCNGKKAMQVDDFCTIAGKQWKELWPEESRPLIAAALEQARNGQISRFESFCPTAKGEPRWWEVTVSPIRSASGEVDYFLSTSRDVSNRRRREDAAATVATEMRHRLRNVHAISASLLMASAPAGSEHFEFAVTVADRLSRLANLQAKLLETDGGLPLTEMCDDVSRVFEQTGGALHCDGLPDVYLDEERARAISLILGELTTNSLKHGALGRGSDARIKGSVEDDELQLDWNEHFDRDASAPVALSSGQGAMLMARILRLYRGSIQSELNETGFQARVRLPLR